MADALMVSSSFLPGQGGIESFLAELCEQLAPRVAVLATGKRDGKELPDDLGYPTHPFPGPLLRPSDKAAAATLAAAKAEGTTKVLFGTPWPLVLMGPKLKAKGLRYAVIVHGAELLVPSGVPVLKSRIARALAEADLLLPVSNFTANETRNVIEGAGLEVPPIEILRARVDLDRFHPDVPTDDIRTELGIKPDDKVILCFGRLVKRKGVDRMIAAMPEITRRVPSAVLVVAGTGPEERSLRALAGRSGARVVFAGRVPDAKAPAVYAMADVFALPVVDRWFGLEIEGLGVVLLEAAASGVPCVTGTSGGTPEAVVHDETGYVLDATDAAALVDRISWLLQNPHRAAEMGRAGRQHVDAEFTQRSVPGALLAWLSPQGMHEDG